MHNTTSILHLIEQWRDENHDAVVEDFNIKPYYGQFGIRLSLKEELRKGEKLVPAISESGNLVFCSGWPNTKVLSIQDIYESRQYRLIATTDTGEEHYSEWFDLESEARQLKNEIDKEDNGYLTSEIQKRIKELEKDEPDEKLTKINPKLKKTPPPPPKKTEGEDEGNAPAEGEKFTDATRKADMEQREFKRNQKEKKREREAAKNESVELRERTIDDSISATYTDIIPDMVKLNFLADDIWKFSYNLMKQYRIIDDKRMYSWLEIKTVLANIGVNEKNALRLYNKLKKKR